MNLVLKMVVEKELEWVEEKELKLVLTMVVLKELELVVVKEQKSGKLELGKAKRWGLDTEQVWGKLLGMRKGA